jgi:hypothetical protein
MNIKRLTNTDMRIIAIASVIVILCFTVVGLIKQNDIETSPNNVSICKYVYDNQTGGYYSEDCREECGCHIINEYNIIADVDDVGNILGDIINNMTNNTEAEL